MSALPKHLIIVGGGTAGWMAANILAKRWGKLGTRVSLIESSKIPTVGVGEGSTPYLKEFFDSIDISETQWMPACNATYKCGIDFPDWSTKEGYQSYFHPFYSDADNPMAQQFFRLCDLARNGQDTIAKPDDFFLTAALARHSKAPINPNQEARELVYGYHFDAELLGAFLKRHAISLGVNFIDDKVTKVMSNNQGEVALLVTHKHGPLRGDFFFDCSGFAGLLIQQHLGEKIQSFQSQLFNNRAVAIQTPVESPDTIPSHTISQALSAGWAWKIPLANRFGNGYVYSSKYLSQQQAEQELRDYLGPQASNQKALHLQWTPGRIEQHWKSNVMAIGLSQGFLEPLEAPMLFIVQKSIERFIATYSQQGYSAASQCALNQELNTMIDGTRDYLQAHYKLNSRSDTQYWIDSRKNLDMSPTLRALLHTWQTEKNFDLCLSQHQQQLAYLKTSWFCLLAGKGCFPIRSQHTSNIARGSKAKCEQLAAIYPNQLQTLQSLIGTANTCSNP